jgi:hypothetical protein
VAALRAKKGTFKKKDQQKPLPAAGSTPGMPPGMQGELRTGDGLAEAAEAVGRKPEAAEAVGREPGPAALGPAKESDSEATIPDAEKDEKVEMSMQASVLEGGGQDELLTMSSKSRRRM